jgi:hypothetical protein
VSRVGCFPGTFDPLTVAHVAVAEAARKAAGLDRVELVLSEVTLGKEHLAEGDAHRRADAARVVVADRTWLAVVVSPHRLVADLAQGYDAVVMGADKWRQVTDPAWYGDDPAARDAAVARLPRVLVAPRADDRPDGVELLDVHPDHRHVRASAIRAGDPDAQRWTAT